LRALLFWIEKNIGLVNVKNQPGAATINSWFAKDSVLFNVIPGEGTSSDLIIIQRHDHVS
jgi:hypothetical protein